jgi:hypothetical protein
MEQPSAPCLRADKSQAVSSKTADCPEEDCNVLTRYLLDSLGLLPIPPEKFAEMSERGMGRKGPGGVEGTGRTECARGRIGS